MIFPLLWAAWKVLAGITAVVIAVAVISYWDVLQALKKYKLHDKDVGFLVKQHLENGNVKIVGGVFTKRPLGIFPRKLRHEESFEGKLDDKLRQMFAKDNRVKIAL